MAKLTANRLPLLLTVREVSELLRIQRAKIYDLLEGGEVLKGFKLGSDWRLRREDVERLTGKIPIEFFHSHAQRKRDCDQAPDTGDKPAG